MNSQFKLYEYGIDGQDIIRRVSKHWLSFARENNSSHLTTDAVLGHPLWDFITGPEARHLYGLLFDKVRRDQQAITIPFRCDAPDRRRYMQLTILPGEKGSLDFRSELLREELRPRVALFDSTLSRTNDFLNMCAWCKRVETEDTQWLEAEDAIERLDLFGRGRLPNISHGLCGDCRVGLEALLQS